MSSKLYIVTMIDPCGYDSWDVSYHLTKKGAYRAIIDRNYLNWEQCRYIHSGGYDELQMYIREGILQE